MEIGDWEFTQSPISSYCYLNSSCYHENLTQKYVISSRLRREIPLKLQGKRDFSEDLEMTSGRVATWVILSFDAVHEYLSILYPGGVGGFVGAGEGGGAALGTAVYHHKAITMNGTFI